MAVNKFKASVYTNSHDVIAGKVVKNINNDKIYFPTTGISWAGLPGKPNGRRPSFMAFETNDGAAIRRFTFLDIHAPFNTDTSIQSYSAHLYASSREIYKVETLDVVSAASAVKSNAIVHMKSKVDSLVPTAVANRDKTRTAAVDAVIKTIQESHTEGNTLV
ncbi:MAG: hypothetical protein OEV38_13035 [Nitrospira sp.]|nr:hypothetical protein [Nitrospira sp.]